MRYTEGGVVFLFLVASLFLYSYLEGNVLITAGATALIFFMFYRLLLFQRGLKHLQFDLIRWCPEEVIFRGDTVTVEGEVTSNLPVNISLRQKVPENFTLEGGEDHLECALLPGKPRRFRMILKGVRRGSSTLPPPTIEVREPCGLFVESLSAGEPLKLRVHASWQEVLRARAVARRGEVEVRGILERGVEGIRGDLKKIREWMPGDRLRDVAWKASSRLQRLLTKEFDVEVEVPVVVALDISRGMRESSRKYSKLDHAMNIVIQLAAIFERRGQPVGLILYDEMRVVRFLRPRRGAFEDVLLELLLLPPPSTHPPLLISEEGGVKLGKEEQLFVKTLSPFITGSREKLPARLSGHYDVARLISRLKESVAVIYVTDMSFSVKGLLQAALLLKERGLKCTVISPRSYLYTLDSERPKPEELKAAVKARRMRRKATSVLTTTGARVVDITPGQDMEYIMKALKGVMR